jgi:hypothetical protein
MAMNIDIEVDISKFLYVVESDRVSKKYACKPYTSWVGRKFENKQVAICPSVREWMEDNIKRPFRIGHRRDGQIVKFWLEFDNDADGLLFKMFWL